jgi:S-adenosylmethionine hydrolase
MAASVASKIQGTVVDVSADGDLITDITEEQLSGVGRTTDTKIVVDDEHETYGLFDLDHNQPSMTLIAIVEPQKTLRLHLVSDSAAMMLGVRKGASVKVHS